MPLARFELKNEYGLGDPRLYLGATRKKKEDPRIVLDGVAVSGLVGILRQLGDLAEFAAVVFHDVQQQVVTTADRGLKVLNRIQKIEAALPQLEKAVQEQKSHIHFAYIAGCDWHANIQTGQSQFFGSDLPEFMMDSYEECRDPPRLHLLDKFDNAGAGACLKRYSDPSYFRRVMTSFEPLEVEKVQNRMKIQRKKKQRSRGRNGLARYSTHMTLHGKSLNSSMQFASLVTDELSFSVDDASISDTLSKSDFTNELRYFSSNKRSGSVEVHSRPSSMSKELHDGMPAAETSETKQRVDFIFINHNEVSANDYIIQDSLCQQSVPSSSSIICDEKTEMVKFANQTIYRDVPEDGPKNSKFAEDSSALSNWNHGTDVLGQEKHVLRSLSWDESITDNLGALAEIVSASSSTLSKENATTNLETRSSTSSSGLDEKAHRSDGLGMLEEHGSTSLSSDENATDNLGASAENIPSSPSSLSKESTTNLFETHGSTSSAAWDEKAQTLEPKSHSFADCILDRPRDSDLLLFTLETSNQQCEMAVTEMVKQDNALPNANKMVVSSGGQLGNQSSQLDKYLDATNALNSRAQTAFEYQDGGVMLLPYQRYDGGCEKIQAVATPNVDIANGEIALGSCASLYENFSPQGFGHFQSVSSAEFAHSMHSPVENTVSKSLVCDSVMINDSKGSSNAPCPELIIPSTQAVVIDGIPVEESSLQDSFSDTYAKSASEEEVYCEQQTKHETGSTSNLNCQQMESQSNMKNVIVTSKLYGLGSETHVASCSSLDDNAFPILSDLMNSNSVDSISSSTLSSDEASSRNHTNKFSPRNDSEGPDSNMSAHLTTTSVFLPSDVDFHGFPVDTVSRPSINIWTNGGLLGLEPSKPPDINVSNMYGCDDMYENRSTAKTKPGVVCFTEQDIILGKICDAQSNSKLSELHAKDSMQASSFGNLDKGQNAYSGRRLHIDNANNKGDIISSGADIPSSNEAESTESRQNHFSISAGFSNLAHRFLVNSLQRRSSMTGISPLSELVNSDVLKVHGNSIHIKHKERSKQAISSTPLYFLDNKEDIEHGFSEKLLSSSLNSSGYCSPPLEHMKVSFQPMKDLDASKLKLEFCNTHPLGNMGDTMFPSFQLLSESFQPLLDDVLDSDDDTFCRSCPYSSDDLVSLNSKSDAEMWGEDETDVSDRIVATASVPSSLESDLGNGCSESLANNISNLKQWTAELSVNSGDIKDLLNISSLEISERQLRTCNPSTEQTDMLSRLPNGQQPSSPFPPTQSRVMKPSFACIENMISGEGRTDSSLHSLPIESSDFHQL